MINEKKEHPSYGMLSFSRVTGGNQSLFGSSVKHNEKIVLKVSHAYVSRDLSQEWYMPEGTIVEAEMSYTQFAEAITSMNTVGIPCTITYTEKEGRVADCDFTVTREKYEEEFKNLRLQANQTTNELISQLQEVLTKGKVTKRDIQECITKLNKISMDINENADFVYKQFNKQMDKTSLEAKNEVEAFVQHKVQSLGMERLKEIHEANSYLPKEE